ncbi:MAG: signal peptidase I [Candidatus Pacebacteria bacterium]|nr:signal peptidase I [Candidatus Paceibacterota bacterium]
MESQHHTHSTATPSNAPLETNTTPPKKEEGFVTEIIRFSIIAFIIVLPIRMFIAQPFIVSGASMETTFSSGQYLIVDQVSYRFEEPKRGDVIIFRYPKDPSKFFIKRIIGIPGDTVTITGDTVQLDNKHFDAPTQLDEHYVLDMHINHDVEEVLGDGEYFVMGDNRNASSDSRMWGVLQRNHIIGKALIRLFPFTKLDVLPGAYDIDAEIMSSQ